MAAARTRRYSPYPELRFPIKNDLRFSHEYHHSIHCQCRSRGPYLSRGELNACATSLKMAIPQWLRHCLLGSLTANCEPQLRRSRSRVRPPGPRTTSRPVCFPTFGDTIRQKKGTERFWQRCHITPSNSGNPTIRAFLYAGPGLVHSVVTYAVVVGDIDPLRPAASKGARENVAPPLEEISPLKTSQRACALPERSRPRPAQLRRPGRSRPLF